MQCSPRGTAFLLRSDAALVVFMSQHGVLTRTSDLKEVHPPLQGPREDMELGQLAILVRLVHRTFCQTAISNVMVMKHTTTRNDASWDFWVKPE